KSFWPEAVNWTVHILNRCPTLAVKDATPEEAWSGIKPSISHFKVFGSIAYVHVPDNLRKKLDDKSIVCIYLGISDESKAYKLYDPMKRKIVVSKDVKFDETKQWNWESNEIETVKGREVIPDTDACSTSKHSEEANEGYDDHSESMNVNEAHDDDVADQIVPDSEDSDEEDNPPLDKRVSKRPGYLDDFVTDEAEMHNLAIFTPSTDPT
ncbi:retrovirus-related Pol polyprotein from transposon TNT 1-94, partial [Trifolium pratense]